MGIERSLIILKPDALRRGIEYDVLNRFKKKGFDVVDMYMTVASDELLREHYAAVIADKGEKIGDNIVNFMKSGPIIVAVLEGNNAVNAVRTMGGEKTQPAQCPPGTIRHDYSMDSYDLADKENRCLENVLHSSDSAESATREIGLWFDKYYRAGQSRAVEKKE